MMPVAALSIIFVSHAAECSFPMNEKSFDLEKYIMIYIAKTIALPMHRVTYLFRHIPSLTLSMTFAEHQFDFSRMDSRHSSKFGGIPHKERGN